VEVWLSSQSIQELPVGTIPLFVIGKDPGGHVINTLTLPVVV